MRNELTPDTEAYAFEEVTLVLPILQRYVAVERNNGQLEVMFASETAREMHNKRTNMVGKLTKVSRRVKKRFITKGVWEHDEWRDIG